MAKERRRVVYSGRVQGVGFRFTCQRLASGFDVCGTVRNMPDGTVELVGDGEAAVLDAFLAAVRAEMKGFIRSASVTPEEPGETFEPGLSIRY